VGRVFQHGELEQMAEIYLRNNIIICSVEIHCELLFPKYRHVPIDSLAPEIADLTITLIAPNKTFNIADLRFSVAIVPDPRLREKLEVCQTRLGPWYRHNGVCSHLGRLSLWSAMTGLLDYLEANRDFLVRYVTTQLPGVAISEPEGTYLGWLDYRKANFPGSPHDFFLNKAKVVKGRVGFPGRWSATCPRPFPPTCCVDASPFLR